MSVGTYFSITLSLTWIDVNASLNSVSFSTVRDVKSRYLPNHFPQVTLRDYSDTKEMNSTSSMKTRVYGISDTFLVIDA